MCQLSKKIAFLLVSCNPTDPKVQDQFNATVKTMGGPQLFYMEHTAIVLSPMAGLEWILRGSSLEIIRPEDAIGIRLLIDKKTGNAVGSVSWASAGRLRLVTYSLHPDISYAVHSDEDGEELIAYLNGFVRRR